MFTFSLIFSGISVVLAIFMIVVASRASKRVGVKIFRYLGVSFFFILIPNLVLVLALTGRTALLPLAIPAFAVSDLIILVLYYGAMMRGT